MDVDQTRFRDDRFWDWTEKKSLIVYQGRSIALQRLKRAIMSSFITLT